MRATFTMLSIGALLNGVAQKSGGFPDYIVDPAAQTIDAKGRWRLFDVEIRIWPQYLPDTLSDTLQYLNTQGWSYVNENYANRRRCAELAWQVMQQRNNYDIDFEMTLRDSLAVLHPGVPSRSLRLLDDSTMRFVLNAEATEAFFSAPLVPLRELIKNDRWYVFTIWNEGILDAPSRYWTIWFQLDRNGMVRAWHDIRGTHLPAPWRH